MPPCIRVASGSGECWCVGLADAGADGQPETAGGWHANPHLSSAASAGSLTRSTYCSSTSRHSPAISGRPRQSLRHDAQRSVRAWRAQSDMQRRALSVYLQRYIAPHTPKRSTAPRLAFTTTPIGCRAARRALAPLPRAARAAEAAGRARCAMLGVVARRALTRAARALGPGAVRAESSVAAATSPSPEPAALDCFPSQDPVMKPYYQRLASLRVIPAASPKEASPSERQARYCCRAHWQPRCGPYPRRAAQRAAERSARAAATVPRAPRRVSWRCFAWSTGRCRRASWRAT